VLLAERFEIGLWRKQAFLKTGSRTEKLAHRLCCLAADSIVREVAPVIFEIESIEMEGSREPEPVLDSFGDLFASKGLKKTRERKKKVKTKENPLTDPSSFSTLPPWTQCRRCACPGCPLHRRAGG
jgi:hypothetical protein